MSSYIIKQYQMTSVLIQHLSLNERLSAYKQNLKNLKNSYRKQNKSIELYLQQLREVEWDISRLARDLERVARLMNERYWAIILNNAERDVITNVQFSDFEDRISLSVNYMEDIDWYFTDAKTRLTCHFNENKENYPTDD